ncbi:TetR/AcrR family transcriptional regulator [Arthrobacter sp. ISL-48]|uniref:TetR/AcrR family transcriptional regulator n=1 Tax=Arthrobacter sp. ISL-48 TaxID=2819110 RepID=UPI001BE7812B|nr:TetR/AcrR family transcriptional regulator [Arthrobacter sp. ISL-48]MBT2532547.1 TetR/AcrR family transcriptional regulator [Arthrobacter sp. ISL-48]
MTGTGPHGRPLDSRVDRTVVDATLALLAERGYDTLTTAAVARRAGVSTASLYRRWSSKEKLLESAARALMAAFLRPEDTGTLAGDLTSLFRDKIHALSGEAGTVLKVLVGQAAHDPSVAQILEEEVSDVSHVLLVTILNRAAARGEVHDGYDADLAAQVAIGLVTTPLLLHADGPKAVGRLVPEQLTDAVMTMVSNQIASS